MAITIDGSGTVTGVSVGGLPDGIVDTDMLAASAVSSAKLASGAGGKFQSYAIIADEKNTNTDAGSSTGGSWNTRDLNTEIADADGIVSISSNQFTLQAGTYFLEASAPAYQPSRHRIKLYQTSGTAADVALGTCEFSNNNDAMVTRSFLSCRFTISTATTYEIRHFVQESKSGNGLGVAMNQGTEQYCVVKIFKET
tara:strand:+ start:58 stop:648 length:591 start_codon:yes stop_codon:yes gene_type:complete